MKSRRDGCSRVPDPQGEPAAAFQHHARSGAPRESRSGHRRRVGGEHPPLHRDAADGVAVVGSGDELDPPVSQREAPGKPLDPVHAGLEPVQRHHREPATLALRRARRSAFQASHSAAKRSGHGPSQAPRRRSSLPAPEERRRRTRASRPGPGGSTSTRPGVPPRPITDRVTSSPSMAWTCPMRRLSTPIAGSRPIPATMSSSRDVPSRAEATRTSRPPHPTTPGHAPGAPQVTRINVRWDAPARRSPRSAAASAALPWRA